MDTLNIKQLNILQRAPFPRLDHWLTSLFVIRWDSCDPPSQGHWGRCKRLWVTPRSANCMICPGSVSCIRVGVVRTHESPTFLSLCWVSPKLPQAAPLRPEAPGRHSCLPCPPTAAAGITLAPPSQFASCQFGPAQAQPTPTCQAGKGVRSQPEKAERWDWGDCLLPEKEGEKCREKVAGTQGHTGSKGCYDTYLGVIFLVLGLQLVGLIYVLGDPMWWQI